MARTKKINVEETQDTSAIDATNLIPTPELEAPEAAPTDTTDTPVEETPVSPEQPPLTLQQGFERYPNASLRKLSMATSISYGVLLKRSKDPVAGMTYNPDAINWEALEASVARKGLKVAGLDWELIGAGANRPTATLQKDVSAFGVGVKVYLRRNNEVPYEIIYKTDTHIVLMLEGSSEPIAWSHNTFIMQDPVFQPRATTAKSGEAKAPKVEGDQDVQ